MKSSLLRSEPMAICLMIGSSRSAADPWRYCGVTAVSSTTTPAALALARPAAAPTSSTLAAAMRASAATSSRRANSPPAMGDPSGQWVGWCVRWAAAYRRPRTPSSSVPPEGRAQTSTVRRITQRHLAILPVTDEAELLVERLRAGVQVGAALRLPVDDLLRIGLDHSPAGRGDLSEHGRHRGPRDALPAVLAAGEDAADPPLRQGREVRLVGRGVLDAGELVGGAELAPADRVAAVVHQHLVHGAPVGVRPLGNPVVLGGPGQALGVEADAPAPAPHAVVAPRRVPRSRPRSPG